jgi:hypothetical protein
MHARGPQSQDLIECRRDVRVDVLPAARPCVSPAFLAVAGGGLLDFCRGDPGLELGSEPGAAETAVTHRAARVEAVRVEAPRAAAGSEPGQDRAVDLDVVLDHNQVVSSSPALADGCPVGVRVAGDVDQFSIGGVGNEGSGYRIREGCPAVGGVAAQDSHGNDLSSCRRSSDGTSGPLKRDRSGIRAPPAAPCGRGLMAGRLPSKQLDESSILSVRSKL